MMPTKRTRCMQTSEQPPKHSRSRRLHLIRLTVRFMRRYPSHPETLEPFIASLAEFGVPQTNQENLRTFLTAMATIRTDPATWYRFDRYLLTGIGAIDLVLLP